MGLVSLAATDNLAVLASTFTKPELIKLLDLTSERNTKRDELVANIVEKDAASDRARLQSADTFITVSGFIEFTVFKLCFFGNGYQDMSEFVLRDLGVFTYENYQINQHTRVFRHREQIEAHLQCMLCGETLDAADLQDSQVLMEVTKHLPAQSLGDPHLHRRIDRIRNRVARQLERLNKPTQALTLYQQSSHPPARERQTRVLMHLERWTEAQSVCNAIRQQPHTDEELQFVDIIEPKLRKKMNLAVVKQPRFKPNTTRLTLTPGDERVESIARTFYSQFGDCFYVENALINGVLGLFIWDIIFAPVEGVFYNPFQSAPADFYQSEFYHKRAELFETRFNELKDPLQFSARVWDTYQSRAGIMNPLVSWGMLSEPLLSLALMRIPVDDWRVLFDRILKDLRNHSSGLPDLILFPKPGADSSAASKTAINTGVGDSFGGRVDNNLGKYELIEIKGPGDAVQKNQRRWMAYFAEHRIPYRVVHIRWAQLQEPV